MVDETAWAVVSGRILVNTVSATRRAAIVNYLVTKHAINVTNAWSDEDIERCWTHWGAYSECRQVRVSDLGPVGDIAKSDDKLYREMVEKLHRKRFNVGTTDGYTVVIRDPQDTEVQS